MKRISYPTTRDRRGSPPVRSSRRAARLAGVSALGLLTATAVPAHAAQADAAGAAGDRGDGLRITAEQESTRPTGNPHNIEVRVDPRQHAPVLAIGLAESERIAVRGQSVTFVTYSNYSAFIAFREIRIFAAGTPSDGKPVATVKADQDGFARWTPDETTSTALYYVLRVNDGHGHFDETAPQELIVLDAALPDQAPPTRPLFGTRDEARIRTIPIDKSISLTITGQVDPMDELVRVSGQIVPIEIDGRFVTEQIVPATSQQVRIAVGNGGANNFIALRDVQTPLREWFVVGQADLTMVSSKGSGPTIEVGGDKLADGNFVTSRAALYAKGRFKDGTRLTASLDTGETLLSDLFSNIDRKDPRQLLRRMNSSEYYTTYGDDSTLSEDAPTQGRFYLRLQKAQSSLLVGNFTTDIEQAQLARINRGLFGAVVDYRSTGATSFGEVRRRVTAFASNPGTLPGRDEFRGTGGSLYFLKRQDLTVGSERLSIEVRDRNTGLVLSQRDLRTQEDYDIDYVQGRVTLLKPLSAYAADLSLVRSATENGNVPVLVVHYEYTPALGSVTGYTIGGRASVWLGDAVRLGLTGQRETTATADQTLIGQDVTLRVRAGTYLKAEMARSQGPGFGQSNSINGGLSFVDHEAVGKVGYSALAWRGELAIDFAELAGGDGDNGKASAYYEHRDAGFGANGALAPDAANRWGATLDLPLSAQTRLGLRAEQFDVAATGKRTSAAGKLVQQLLSDLTMSVEVQYEALKNGLLNNSTQIGPRTDGAVQIDYAPKDENWSLRGFGQATIDRDSTRRRNDRTGLGAKLELSDRLSLDGEVSVGDGGLGAVVSLHHRYGSGSENYLGYALLSDRTDLGLAPDIDITQTNQGTLVFGKRHRFSSVLSAHGENKLGFGGASPSIQHSFGLNWNPDKRWSLSGTFEAGKIDSLQTGRFSRTSATFGVGYTSSNLQLGSNVEARFENGSGHNQTVWLFRNTAVFANGTDWRLMSRFNIAVAKNDTVNVRAADFVEGSLGFAYRPTDNDRLNLLGRVTYLRDMGPIGQISAGGTTGSPKQKSAIIALDANYDLTGTLTLGGKYGYRQGSVSLGRTSDTYVSSNSHLGVVRLDWRPVRQWDGLIEIHYLSSDLTRDSRWGGLVAMYRHLNDKVKVGIGYSHSEYSTDLADQSYKSRGLFFNILGKF